MQQFIGLIIAFVMLPVILKAWPKVFKKKAPLGPVLMITGVIMAVIGGLGVGVLGKSLVKVFTTFSSLQTLIVVIEIGILGSILKQYGILDKIVHALEQLIPSKKALIMILPAIMGALPVPGGAFLSAPFVDSLGSELGISGERKSVINLYFRHFSLFVLPYNTTLLTITSSLPDINLGHFILMNLPFVAIQMTGAWFFYVRTAPTVKAPKSGSKGKAALDVLKYLSPIYMALVFNMVFGLDMYLALLLCLVICFFVVGSDKSQFVPAAVKGFSIDNALMLVGVYFMQNVVKSLDVVMAGVGSLLVGDSVLAFMLIVPLVGLAFGLSTGLSLVPMGILLPFVLAMGLSPAGQLAFGFYILVWSYLGYYFSPFHLCQLLTVKAMGCPTGPVYKEHIKMMPVLCTASVVLFLIYHTVLL